MYSQCAYFLRASKIQSTGKPNTLGRVINLKLLTLIHLIKHITDNNPHLSQWFLHEYLQ